MPSVPLPENPSLEHLKKQAKLLQELVRSGDEGALDMVREFHPRLGNLDESSDGITDFSRTNAQLVIARFYGFSGWSNLRAHVELAREHTLPDPADRDEDPSKGADSGSVEEFVSLACVSYNPVDVHARLAEARRMLAGDPALASGSAAALAVTGDHLALADLVSADPSGVDLPTGPNNWPLVLYCTYSRVTPDGDRYSAVETLRLLLDRGADPNAGFLWHGLVPPFTALTGTLGRGEGDQPRHPDWQVMARMLLEAGADPNDGQGLYNNGLAGTAHDDPAHLEILSEFGLGRAHDGPWYRRFGDRLTAPSELLYDELEVAAWRNLPNRMRFLVGLGLDLDRPVGRSGQRPLQLALDAGHDEIVAILRSAGAGQS